MKQGKKRKKLKNKKKKYRRKDQFNSQRRALNRPYRSFIIPGISKANTYGSLDDFTIVIIKQVGLMKPTNFKISKGFPHYASPVL